MSSIVDELVVSLGIDVNPGSFEQVKRMSEGIEKITATALKMGAGISAAVTGWLFMVDKMDSGAAKFEAAHLELGVGIKILQEYGFALTQVGGKAEDAIDMFKKMASALSHVEPGEFSGALFKLLGAEGYMKLIHEDQGQRFLDVARAVQRFSKEDQYNWLKKAGFSDTEILLIQQGPEAIQKQLNKAATSGQMYPEGVPEKAREGRIAIQNMWQQVEVLSGTIAANFTPNLQVLNEELGKWIEKNKEIINQDITAVVLGIGEGFKDAGKAVEWLTDKIKGFLPQMDNLETKVRYFTDVVLALMVAKLVLPVVGALTSMVLGLGSVATAAGTAGGALALGSPFGIALLAITGVIVALVTHTKELNDNLNNTIRLNDQIGLQKGYSVNPSKQPKKGTIDVLRDLIKRDLVDPMDRALQWLGIEEKPREKAFGESSPLAPGRHPLPKRPMPGQRTDIQRTGAGKKASIIKDALMEGGLSREAAEALTAVWHYESGGLKPDAHEKGGSGYGLAQWTGPRRKQLEAFAKAAGKPVSDLQTQIAFAIQEIRTNPAYAKLLGSGSLEEMLKFAVNVYEAPRADLRAREYQRSLPTAQKIHNGDVHYNVTQHIHGNQAPEIADRSKSKLMIALQQTYPGGTAPVTG